MISTQVVPAHSITIYGNTELRADADGHGANVRTLEDADGAELLPDARALAGADQNPDAVTKLELLAFVRTHGAADVKTVGRALVDPVAAALDADAERRPDADAVARAVRASYAGPDLFKAAITFPKLAPDASPDEVAVPLVRGGLRGLDAVQGLRELPLVRSRC